MACDDFTMNDLVLSCKDGTVNLQSKNAVTEETQNLRAQLAIINQSLDFILLIIAGVVLSFYATTLTRKQLLCALCPEKKGCDCIPDPIIFRLISSILVLVALIYFFILSDQGICGPHENCVSARSASYNNTASLLVLIAAIIRIIDLIVVWLSSPA